MFHPNCRPLLLAAGLLLAVGSGALGGTAMSFQLTSAAFSDGQVIPVSHSCDGDSTSPPLRWSGAPSGTRSFALVLHDPDAPSGDFTHWLLFDLPSTITEIPSGKYQEENFPLGGLEGRNSFGNIGYGAPCPPQGPAHHYVFDLYALDQPSLGLSSGAGRGQLEQALRGKILAHAELKGTYQRQ